MSKFLLLFLFMLVAYTKSHAQRPNNSIKTLISKYDFFIYKCCDMDLAFTSFYGVFGLEIISGFQAMDTNSFQEVVHDLKTGDSWKWKFERSENIDTIHNILWEHCGVCVDNQDTNIFYKKLLYSYILNKFGGEVISKHGTPMFRLLYNKDYFSADKEWILYSGDLSSGKFIHAVGESDDKLGFVIISKKETKNTERQKMKLLKLLNKFKEYENIEIVIPNNAKFRYPFLLEYFDGKNYHLFFSNDNRKVKRHMNYLFGRVFTKIVQVCK